MGSWPSSISRKTWSRRPRDAYAAGYRFMEAYTPFPVEGLAEALGFRSQWDRADCLARRLDRRIWAAFSCMWYSSVVHFPLDIGGRPYNSWPAFIPITFELTILVAALSAVFGMLGLNGLPRPHHPVFNVPELCAGVAQPVLSLLAGARPAV